MSRFNVMPRATSIYICDVCGFTVRDYSGKTHLGHIHNDERGNYLGKDAEGKMIEHEDDGRDAEDLRETVWMA